MTKAQRDIRRKLRILTYGKEIGNIPKTCWWDRSSPTRIGSAQDSQGEERKKSLERFEVQSMRFEAKGLFACIL
jgi:hypothetical protein